MFALLLCQIKILLSKSTWISLSVNSLIRLSKYRFEYRLVHAGTHWRGKPLNGAQIRGELVIRLL